jgi:spermidine synthase
MNLRAGLILMAHVGLANQAQMAAGQVVFETTSPYHHIRVIDEGRLRVLTFDSATESRISLDNPLLGHFEYTEYFHLPWLWNDQLKTVLMIGLGGGSTQRAFQHYYPEVSSETVELDPKVIQVARDFFQLKESDKLKVITGDGRVHLRRTQKKYDTILLDAYTANRYGSFIPYSLATKEFFALASDHLTTNGVLAYNIIGTIEGEQESIVGAIYRTIKTTFPRVYLCPAVSSQNVVVLATKSSEPWSLLQLNRKADELIQAKRMTFPNFKTRLRSLQLEPPLSAANSRVLTDDFAPVDGLLKAE